MLIHLTVSSGEATGTPTNPCAGRAVKSFAAAAGRGRAGLYRGQKTINGKTYLACVMLLNDKRGRGGIIIKTTIASGVEWTGQHSSIPPPESVPSRCL